MAYTTINKSTDYFNTKLYTGNGGTLNVTGVGFQPDLVWQKSRSLAYNHNLYDVIRGANAHLRSNLTAAEASPSDGLTSFNSDGYTMVQGGAVEASNNGATYATWNWLASNTTASNTDGSITSTVSANTTSGFSIVSYTGNNTAGATVGHGLGSAPKMIIFKSRSGTKNWITYHDGIGNTKAMFLNLTNAEATGSDYWNNTSPTSSVFTLGDNSNHNDTSANMIAYCFADKQGFSKFGSYTGNGDADGTFVYTGFKPAFVMIKRTSSTGNWLLLDNKRVGYNGSNYWIEANKSDAENTTANWIDILSNGFKLRLSGSSGNSDGNSYIYMAFAEAPLVGSNNIPAMAR